MATLKNYIFEFSEKNKQDLDYPVYSVTNSNGFCVDYFDKDVSSKNKKTYKIVPRGYFAYNPSRINVGSIDWQNCEDNVLVSPLYTVFRCSEDLDQEYLKMFLKSDYGLQLINLNVSGSVRNNLKFDVLKKFDLKIGDVEEQKEVVLELNRIIKAIEVEKKQISLYEELVKSRFVEMFEGKYPTVKLGTVIDTTSGGTPLKSKTEYYDNGTIPWLTSGEVNAGIITSSKNFITEAGMKNSSAKLIPANSVVVAMYGATAGVTGLLRIETTTNQAVCSLLPNDNYIPEYLYHAVSSKKEWMISQCKGGGQPNISQTIIKDLDLVDAPIDKQISFSDFATQVDKSKFVCQERIALYNELLNKKMDEYFNPEEDKA